MRTASRDLVLVERSRGRARRRRLARAASSAREGGRGHAREHASDPFAPGRDPPAQPAPDGRRAGAPRPPRFARGPRSRDLARGGRADSSAARATSPRGETCRVSAAI